MSAEAGVARVKSGGRRLFRALAGVLCVAALSGRLAANAQEAPVELEAAPVAPPAAGRIPVLLDLTRRAEVRQRLTASAERVVANVVRLSIERRIGDGVMFSVEASGLVVDADGHVVTIGSSLDQAGRIAVHFQGLDPLRPRRARVIGVDERTDVGVLSIGPVPLPPLEFATLEAPAAEKRYVVTLFGQGDVEEGPLALGWLQEPLRNPMVGQRRFDQLLRVTLVRTPESAGGVIAGQDGRVAGLLLQPPPQGAGFSGAPQPLLALPASAMQLGLKTVLDAAATSLQPPTGSADDGARAAGGAGASRVARVVAGRPWIGFGARDLVEPEFLAQLDQAGAVVVTDVFEASPALAADLAPHDLVTAWNGTPLQSVEQLTAQIAATAPGTVVELECLRRLERRTVKVTLGEW